MDDESLIPCRHPYTRPRLRCDEPMAVLVVGKGTRQMSFRVPAKMLQTHLDYPRNK